MQNTRSMYSSVNLICSYLLFAPEITQMTYHVFISWTLSFSFFQNLIQQHFPSKEDHNASIAVYLFLFDSEYLTDDQSFPAPSV